MSTSSIVPAVTDAELVTLLSADSGAVAVEFTAAWCAPCRTMAPVVETLARECGPALRVVQLDSDAHSAASVRYGVRGLPTLLLFRDGALTTRVTGAMPLAQLRERLRPHLPAQAG